MTCECGGQCCARIEEAHNLIDHLYGMIAVLTVNDYLSAFAETMEERVNLVQHEYETFLELLPEKYKAELVRVLENTGVGPES